MLLFQVRKNETVVHIYASNYNHYLNSHTDILTSYNRVFGVPQNEYINSKNPKHLSQIMQNFTRSFTWKKKRKFYLSKNLGLYVISDRNKMSLLPQWLGSRGNEKKPSLNTYIWWHKFMQRNRNLMEDKNLDYDSSFFHSAIHHQHSSSNFKVYFIYKNIKSCIFSIKENEGFWLKM